MNQKINALEEKIDLIESIWKSPEHLPAGIDLIWEDLAAELRYLIWLERDY